MAVADSTQRERTPLIQGTDMICPRCKKPHNILAYIPMEQIEEFKNETNAVYRCPSCRWVFSPTDESLWKAMAA